MPNRYLSLFCFFITFLSVLHSVNAQSNVAVPISNTTQIVRSGSGWTDNQPIPVTGVNTVCGSWTRTDGDSISFTFNGTSVSVNGDIFLTDRTQATIDGRVLTPNPEVGGQVCSEALYSVDGLEPTQHTLVVTAVANGGTPLLIVESITYISVPPSTSSSSSTMPSTTTSTTSSVTPTASSSSATPPSSSDDPSIHVPSENVRTSSHTGAIAGGTAGGIVGLVLLIVALVFQGNNLVYLLSSIGFSMFGWFFFKGRVFVFIPDGKIDPVEITIFMSNQEVISDFPKEANQALLVWQVVKLGHSRKTIHISSPCLKGTGETRLGFGDVIDAKTAIRSEHFGAAPVCYNADDTWTDLERDTSDLSSSGLVFKNGSEGTISVTMGTLDTGKESFLPFRKITDIAPGAAHTVDTNLYLHAFTTHGYEAGGYRDNLVKDVIKDKITPEKGIKVADLKPRSIWYITQTGLKTYKLRIKGLVKSKEKVMV